MSPESPKHPSSDSQHPSEKPTEATERFPEEPEEDFIAHAHELVRASVKDPDPEKVRTIHSLYESSHHARVYREYANGRFLTTTVLQQSVDGICAAIDSVLPEDLGESERAALEKERAYFAGRPRQIEYAARRYADSVEQFFRIKQLQVRLESHDFVERMERADRNRRRLHDALIESITEYTQRARALVADGYLEKNRIVPWIDGAAATSTESIYIFPDPFLRNRELIRDWAIAVDLSAGIAAVEQSLAKLEAEEKKEPPANADG